MTKEMQKVKCSMCGNIMDCPENMLKAEKHICSDCSEKIAPDEDFFKEMQQEINEIKPIMDEICRHIIDGSFEEEWMDSKKDLKQLTKKELAKASFSLGVNNALSVLALSGIGKEIYEHVLSVLKAAEGDEEEMEKLMKQTEELKKEK